MQYFWEGLDRIHRVSKTEFKCVRIVQKWINNILYKHNILYGSKSTILMLKKTMHSRRQSYISRTVHSAVETFY